MLKLIEGSVARIHAHGKQANRSLFKDDDVILKGEFLALSTFEKNWEEDAELGAGVCSVPVLLMKRFIKAMGMWAKEV